MRILGFLILCLLSGSAAVAAQLQGRVLNPQGAGLPGIKVTLQGGDGVPSREVVTGTDGSYAIDNLEPGTYTLTVAAPSVAAPLSRQVTIGPGAEPMRADFQLPQTPTAAAPAAIAAEERNPNIFVYRIDLNDLRNRLTTGRGPDPAYVPQFSADQNYFGAEFGAPLAGYEILRPRSLLSQWHGSLSALHQNSALNARNFFDAGPLQASRSTSYSATGTGPLSARASLLLQYGQTLTSGAVNSNIQAPLASERIPTATDPLKRGIIAGLLNAYPAELPNLRGRRLNSNAPRDVNSKDALARVDFKYGPNSALALRYTVNDYSEDPFQLVAGQNPQTDVRTQGAYLSWTQTFSPQTVSRFAFNFDRTGAALLPTKQFSSLFASLGIAAVPDIDFVSDGFTDIGPGTQFPRRRAQNRFQLYADWAHTSGRHSLKAGWSSTRVQLNDLQSDNSRGTFKFAGDFGRTELENFLLGTPSSFTIGLGNFYRGFRNWEHFGFVEDQVRLSPTLTATAGVRYELMTAPWEVNGLTDPHFHTDKNNFSPRVGLAWNPNKGKTVIRAAYGISYSQIFPVTYGMTRFNPPANQSVQIQAPDLVNPLAGFSTEPTPGARTSLFQLSPDLVNPYSHQYSFSIERSLPWAATMRVAYIGMRSFHLLMQQVYNRARPSTDPAIPNTTGTINQRRPDLRYFDINMVQSDGNAYYDALQLSMDQRLRHGLTFRASYTFGKNIDTGGDFTNTASGVEKPPETGISSCEVCDHVSDHKGVSLFDTPQVFVLSYTYNVPFPRGSNSWAERLFSGWQVSGATNFQSGTPFHIHTGSDGPGFGNVDGVVFDRPNILKPALLGMSVDDPDTSRIILEADSCTRPNVPNQMTGEARPYLWCNALDDNLPVGGRGNIGLNVFRKDGTSNWNFSIARTFRLAGQEHSLQFRTEFINLFNHAQFEKPGVNVASDTFAEITNTVNKGRQVQFSLRANF